MRIFFVFLLFFAFMVLFFLLNPSYQASFQAKFHYNLGDFNKSKMLAKEALQIDIYNKMANAIFTQSEISIEYENYINLGFEYLATIKKMSKESVDLAKESKIRLICDTMIDGYERLKSSNLINQELKDSSKDIYEKFLKLKNELF